MGLTLGRVVSTATAAYNLAGDPADRANFRKSVVVGSVLQGAESIGRAISQAYLTGPGTKLRRFHAWALDYYGLIGTPGELRLKIETVLANDIRPLVVGILPPGSTPAIQGIEIGLADYLYFAEQHILANYPDEFGTAWTADIDEATGDITITFVSLPAVTFTPTDFDKDSLYIYATYYADTVLGIYIYRIGSGDPVLDLLATQELEGSNAYFPIIPVRLDGNTLSDSYEPTLYSLAKRAYKKASGAKLTKLIDELEENENIDDVDYAYVVYGASANTQQQSQLEYIYRFLGDQADRVDEAAAAVEYDDWANNDVPTTIDQLNYWTTYDDGAPPEEGQTDPDPPPGYSNPSGNGPDGPPSKPFRGVLIRAPGTADINYDVRIVWTKLERLTGAGLAKPDAAVGEYWFEVSAEEFAYIMPARTTEANFDSGRLDPVVYLYKQTSANSWDAIKIYGMAQRTYVFGNHYEELGLADAIDNTEPGQESSFIFPLRLDLLEEMSLADSTELAIHCQYLTLHTYEIYIQPFYASKLFGYVMVAVIIAITVATGGAGAAAGGVLGSNAAVGTALGASAATAAIVGFVANALAAMILTILIQKGATFLFGEKVGAVVGLVVAVLAINALSNFAAGNGFTLNFGQMSTAESLLRLTSTAADAYTRYISADTKNILAETEELRVEYREEMERIEELYAQNIGYGNGIINPMDFVSSTAVLMETPAVFLQRTLLTGSDIAEISLGMVSNFAEITISTSLP